MGTRLLEFGGVRLVINQSVVPVDWSLHPSELSFRCVLSKVISLVIIRYIKHCLLILPLIYSYMWDLTSWAHIWCVYGFVLKTGCYMGPNGWQGLVAFSGMNNSRYFWNLRRDHPWKVEGPKVGNLPSDLLVWVRALEWKVQVRPWPKRLPHDLS